MSEIVFDRLQLGLQTGTPSAPGAAVAATIIHPIDAGLIDADLDRGYDSPDEDFGELARHQAGRGYYGLRTAGVPVVMDLRFEDAMRVLEMILAGGVTPTGTNPYTWTYTADNSADSCKLYTAEIGTETVQDQYQLSTCLVDELELGYDPITSPGAHPWKARARLVALNRTQAALTAALSAIQGMETVQGHLTTFAEGSTAMAFGSLTELANHLVGYKITISRARPYRPYGGTTDVAAGYGTGKIDARVAMQVKRSASSKAALEDVVNAAGSPASERRARISAAGSGTKVFRIDHRLRYETVKRSERDGESVYDVAAHVVKDATLGSALQAVVINGIAGPLA